MELFDWNMLGGYAGAALAVGILTQVTKEIPGVKSLPTQLWSYLIAYITLALAEAFSTGITVRGAVLAVFNAAVVSLSANGGYSAIKRMMPDADGE